MEQNQFTISNIYAKDHDSSYGGYKWKVVVSVLIDAAYWKRHQKKNLLGSIYNVDIGNYLYRINNAFVSHCPTVDDRARSSKGMKQVTLTYFFNDPERAKALGLEVKYFGKNKEPHAKYGDFVSLTEQLPKPMKLKLAK